MLIHSTGQSSQFVKAFVWFVFTTLLFGFSAHAEIIKVQRQGEYTFITGGIGDDEHAYLEAQAPKYFAVSYFLQFALNIVTNTGGIFNSVFVKYKKIEETTLQRQEKTSPSTEPSFTGQRTDQCARARIKNKIL